MRRRPPGPPLGMAFGLPSEFRQRYFGPEADLLIHSSQDHPSCLFKLAHSDAVRGAGGAGDAIEAACFRLPGPGPRAATVGNFAPPHPRRCTESLVRRSRRGSSRRQPHRQVAGVGHDRLLRSAHSAAHLGVSCRSQLCPPSPEVAMSVGSSDLGVRRGDIALGHASAQRRAQATAFSSPAAPRERLVQVAPPLSVVSAPTPTIDAVRRTGTGDTVAHSHADGDRRSVLHDP